MHSVIWEHGREPQTVRVDVDLYGDIAARLWSAGPESGHFLKVCFTEGHRTKYDSTPVGLFGLNAPIREWREFHALLTEALAAEEAEAAATAAEDAAAAEVTNGQ